MSAADGASTDLLVSVLARARARGVTAADGFLVEEQHFSATVRLGVPAGSTRSSNPPNSPRRKGVARPSSTAATATR